MKTNEFIKEVEVMGFKIVRVGNELRVRDKFHNECARVSEFEIYKIDTIYKRFKSLTYTEQEQLFKLLTEYASTPIEEREKEKKYMYKLKEVGGISLNIHKEYEVYLNYNLEFKEWFLNDNEHSSEFRTHFTHSWLKSRGVDIEQLQEVYEEIEVTE